MKIRICVSKRVVEPQELGIWSRDPTMSLCSKEMEQGPLWKEGRRYYEWKQGKVHLGSMRKGFKHQSKEFRLYSVHKEDSKFLSNRITEGESTLHRSLPGAHSQAQLLLKIARLHKLEAGDSVGMSLGLSFLYWTSWSIFLSHLVDTLKPSEIQARPGT